MSNGSDAADQVVRYTLEGTEVALKLSGLAAKNVVAYLIAVLNDSKKTRGKTRITRMLREGKPMKIFQLPTDQLKVFAKEAKKYGVLFVAMVYKHNPAPDTDIMVFSRDAAKINRILDRLSLAVVDTGAIESEIQNERVDNDPFVHRSDVPFATSSPISSDSQSLPETEEGGRRSVKKLLEAFKEQDKKPIVKGGQNLQQAQPHIRPKRKKKSKPKGKAR